MSLSSLLGWDAAGKVLSVEPSSLGALPKLRHLELFGVRPKNDGLAPLFGLKQLQSARLSKLPDEEVRRFFELTGAVDERTPEPVFDED